jgi:hypothetical protein
MAVDLWVPDSASADGHRFLLCIETSDMLYVLVELAPATGRWSPCDRVPLWVVTASAAGGALPFGGGTRTDSGNRSLIVGVHGAPGPDVESLTLTLYDDEVTVLTARAVRATGPVSVPGVTVWMTDPPPPDQVNSIATNLDGVLVVDGERDFRTLIGLETAEGLVVFIEGPTDRLPPEIWTARASSLRLLSFGMGYRKRQPATAFPLFEPPGPGISALDVELLHDGEVRMRNRLVRPTISPL